MRIMYLTCHLSCIKRFIVTSGNWLFSIIGLLRKNLYRVRIMFVGVSNKISIFMYCPRVNVFNFLIWCGIFLLYVRRELILPAKCQKKTFHATVTLIEILWDIHVERLVDCMVNISCC